MTIQYKFPTLYKLLIRLTHSRELIKTLKNEVGKNNTVFDIAAGFGLTKEYIDPSNSYYGIDLNRTFVKYARKNSLNIKLKNIFDERAYKYSDIFLLIDVVHHIPKEKLKELFDLVFRFARKKVIVVEPYFQSKRSAGVIQKFFNYLMLKLDNDGINNIKRWFTKTEYQELFDTKFGSKFGAPFTPKVQQIPHYYLVTFTK